MSRYCIKYEYYTIYVYPCIFHLWFHIYGYFFVTFFISEFEIKKWLPELRNLYVLFAVEKTQNCKVPILFLQKANQRGRFQQTPSIFFTSYTYEYIFDTSTFRVFLG